MNMEYWAKIFAHESTHLMDCNQQLQTNDIGMHWNQIIYNNGFGHEIVWGAYIENTPKYQPQWNRLTHLKWINLPNFRTFHKMVFPLYDSNFMQGHINIEVLSMWFPFTLTNTQPFLFYDDTWGWTSAIISTEGRTFNLNPRVATTGTYCRGHWIIRPFESR